MALDTKNLELSEELVTGMMSKVKGHSSIARLCGQDAIPFVGEKIFTFTLDKEADLVGENEKKSEGGSSIGIVKVVPYKFEYSMRTSDEFMIANEEYQLGVLEQFTNGAAKKFARAIDLSSMHGVNPRTNAIATLIGDNYFDKAVTNTVDYVAASADDNLRAAMALITGNDEEHNGIAMSPTFAAAMGAIKNDLTGELRYPDFDFGGHPNAFAGDTLDVNNTVSKKASDGTDTDHAIIGDFANMFKWGYAKEMPVELIEYGDPDNTGKDLKGYNQVLLRMEAFIGWGILEPNAFARIKVSE